MQPRPYEAHNSWIRGYHVMFLLLLGVIFQMGLIMYWSLWPFDVFQFTAPLKVLNPYAVAGGVIKYEMSYCKSKSFQNYAAQVQLLYINQQIIYTPSWTQFIEPGCRTEEVWATIPELAPGKYKLILYREYQVNPIRTLRFEAESNFFEVISAEEYKKRINR
jgi:hypothetical protein